MDSMKRFDLSGKTALITGGAGLLGTQHAAALAEVGATVVLSDINAGALEHSAARIQEMGFGSSLIVRQMDVTSEASVSALQETMLSQNRHIDILVNNAAIDAKVQDGAMSLEKSRLEYFDVAEWDRQIKVGLTGAMICARVFGSKMAERGKGVIVNVASDLSVFSPDQRLYKQDGLPPELQPVKPVSYSVIKTGLIGLTRYLATYWADQGVRCNALSPGGVKNGQNDAFVRRLTSLIPAGRMADADEYRAAMQFLCSDASAYMNGQNLVVDGGRSAL